jgi:membrane protein YqaA with SNARE-associated domain
MEWTPDLDPGDQLGAFLFCFLSGASFIINAEATVVVTTTQFGLHPVLAGLGASSGQVILYWMLYKFGDVLARRWRWLNRQVTRTREKYGNQLDERFGILTGFAGVFGLPPVTAMAAIAPGFGMRLLTFLAIAVPLRFLRFLVLGAFSQELAALWSDIFS